MSRQQWTIEIPIAKTKVNAKAVPLDFISSTSGAGHLPPLPGGALDKECFTGTGHTINEAGTDVQFKLSDRRTGIEATIELLKERSEALRLAILGIEWQDEGE